MQARLAREEALFTGSSGGAAAHAAVELAARLPKSALVVTLLPDTGERYLSKFNVPWMEAHGLTKAPAYLKARAATTPKLPSPPIAPRSRKPSVSSVGSVAGRVPRPVMDKSPPPPLPRHLATRKVR
jgi:hypothetical protein